MNSLLAIVKKEGLTLIRNRFFAIPILINILIWGAIIISYERQPYEEVAAAFYDGWMWMILLNLLMVGLIAIYIASKDREMERLISTYPVRNVDWLFGKWLVAQSYGLVITVLTIVIQGIWLLGENEWAQHLFYVFMQMEGAFILIISFGFLMGTWIRHMVAYLTIPAFLLLTLTLPFDNVGAALTYDNPKFHLLTPFDYMFLENPYEGIWGIHRVFSTTILHQSVVIILAIILFCLTVLWFQRHRRLKKEKMTAVISIIIFLIPAVLLGSIRYQKYDQALTQFLELGKQYGSDYTAGMDHIHWWNSYYDRTLDFEPYGISIEKNHLSISLQPDHHIQGTSVLVLKNNRDEAIQDVDLTLYHGLDITECSVDCSRDHDFVTLHLEDALEVGEEVEVKLTYEGNILQYRYDAYVEHAFIDEQRIYLPKEAGWYPLSGKRPLVVARANDGRFSQYELRNGNLMEEFATEFTVEVKNEAGAVPVALTIPKKEEGTYEGVSSYGLSLVGGNVVQKSFDGITIVGHPEVLSVADKIRERHESYWQFIDEWLGVTLRPQVIYILDDEYAHLASTTFSREFYVWSSGYLKYMDNGEILHHVTQNLTYNFPRHENEDFRILSEAIEWVILDHLQDVENFKDWYEERWSFYGDEDKPILARLEEYGDGFSDVIRYLYLYVVNMENKADFNLEEALAQYDEEGRS